MKAHAVVVGGGVMGVSIALHLARRFDPLSQPVVLLEKSQLAAGSSGRSGGILRQHYSSANLASMARDSLKVYSTFARTTGRSIGFQQTGVLVLARSEEDVVLIRRNVAMMIELGIETHCLDSDEIRLLVPGLELEDDTIGAWEPDSGVVDPVKTVEGLAELAKSHGATTRIGLGADGLRIVDGAVVGVETADGLIETGTVILATGPWTGALLARAGIELPLRVVRPEQHFMEMPAAPPGKVGTQMLPTAPTGCDTEERIGPLEEEPPPAAHPVIVDFENGLYARCDSLQGRTRIGSMDTSADAVVEDPDALDEQVSESFRKWARETLEDRFPVYRDCEDLESLASIYTLTPDDQAVIGELPEVAGLFVVSGFSGHGFKLAPSIGEGVAQLVTGEPLSAFDPEVFSPTRFDKETVVEGRGFGL